MRAVLRRLILSLAVFALLWQALPLARLGVAPDQLAKIAHETLHWIGAAHHHHGDGSHHFDRSTDSAQHLVADHFNQTATIADAAAPRLSFGAASAPPQSHSSGLPPPFLEGPLRPPRSLV